MQLNSTPVITSDRLFILCLSSFCSQSVSALNENVLYTCQVHYFSQWIISPSTVMSSFILSIRHILGRQFFPLNLAAVHCAGFGPLAFIQHASKFTHTRIRLGIHADTIKAPRFGLASSVGFYLSQITKNTHN